MAFTITPVLAGTYAFVADIQADADADAASGNIPHGLGAVPVVVALCPLLQVQAGLSLWAVTTIDAVNIVVTKSVAVGSGVAAPQVRLTALLPHSLIS
ncbi:MAG TPA: hypothetical protein VM054_07475 [bacterium]|nr:hypothetical protein [bacterium]